MKKITLILGGNVGEVIQNFYAARILLSRKIGPIKQTSSLHLSKADGYESDHDYYNQVVVLQSKKKPLEILEITQEIECSLGRNEKSINGQYKDRTMDIDILYYGEEKIDLPKLIIPHPRIKERAFVLAPLRELKIIP